MAKANPLKILLRKELNGTHVFTVSFTPAVTFNSKVEESRAPVPVAGGLAAHSASAPEHAGINSAFNHDSFK